MKKLENILAIESGSWLNHPNLLTLIREKSKNALIGMIGDTSVKLSPVAREDDYVYGEHMSYILIYGDKIRITIKAHYSSYDLGEIISVSPGCEGEVTSKTYMNDFMREFCNMASGMIIETLNFNQISTNSSLPFVTRGFDEVIFSDRVVRGEIRDWWELQFGGGSFVCSSSTLVFDEKALHSLDARLTDSGNGITFL